MPGRDGTGPLGEGARTGGGFGNCVTDGNSNFFVNKGFGVTRRPFTRRCGGGRAFRNRYFTPALTQTSMPKAALDETQRLEEHMRSLQAEINTIKEQLETLNKGNQA